MFKSSDNNRQKSWQIISVTFSGEASLDYQVYSYMYNPKQCWKPPNISEYGVLHHFLWSTCLLTEFHLS